MEQDPTPEEFDEQLRQSEEQMAELADMLENEADLLGLMAREQGRELAGRAQENLPVVAGGAAAAGLLLTLLLRGGDDDDVRDGIPVRTLDDDYVGLLSRVVRQRLRSNEGMQLHEALATTLREQAPVFYDRPGRPSSSSWGKRLLGLGLLAAAGVGADYAAKALTGQGLVDWVKNLTGGSSYDVQQEYSAPHGTTGAEVPTPSKQPATDEVFGADKAVPDTPGPTTAPNNLRPEPEGDYSEVHGTAGAEVPDATPDATSETKGSTGAMTGPGASGSAGGANEESLSDQVSDLAEPQGDLPGDEPSSKKE